MGVCNYQQVCEFVAQLPAQHGHGQLPAGEFNARELVNTAWTFATVSRSASSLHRGICNCHHVSALNAHELVHTAWAFEDEDFHRKMRFQEGCGAAASQKMLLEWASVWVARI